MSRSEDARETGSGGPLMTGVIALALLLVHFTLGHVQQGALAATIAASDAQIALEAQKLRQSVLFAHANQPGLDRDVRADEMGEAAAMGQGRGIGGLTEDLEKLRDAARHEQARARVIELAEVALELAILLMAAAMAGQSRRIMYGAGVVAALGVVLAALAGVGITFF